MPTRKKNEHVKIHGYSSRGLFVGFLALGAVLALMLAFATPAAADVDVSAVKYNGIVVDGLADDWSGIPGTTITLIRPLATTERIVDGLTLKVAYDDANIYVLALVDDDFNYNTTDPHKSGSIAVLWQIDPAATPNMGGGLGNVDIWHWELESGPFEPAGGPTWGTGNDPEGNFDDEWSSSPANRFDDTLANELYGAWSHTNMSAENATGTWIFEMRRSLTTSDNLNQDRQFAADTTVGMSFGYWDADELGEGVGWSDSGHYTSCTDPVTLDFSWINVTLEPVVLPQGPPGPAGADGADGADGAAGPQGPAGPAGSADLVAMTSSYAGLGIGIVALAIAVVALLRRK